jgi:molecular chaperone GrpE (heat shock protein)
MLMKTTHGLPISFIRSMPELHQAYQVMNLVRAAPYLHLDYRDQVRAGYGPLTEIEMAAQQIVDNWTAVADDIEQTMSALAPEIRDAVAEYEKKRQYVLQEPVQVSNERDALFDFVGAIEETIATQNKTPVVIEALTELSNLTGLLHAQGWVAINPPHGAQVDQTLHEVVGARNEPGLPADRIVEVRQRGYIRRRPNLGPQIRRAKVIVSSSTGLDVSQHLTVKMP